MGLLGALASTCRSAVARKSKVPQEKLWGAGDEGAVVAHKSRCYGRNNSFAYLYEGLGRAAKNQTSTGFESLVYSHRPTVLRRRIARLRTDFKAQVLTVPMPTTYRNFLD